VAWRVFLKVSLHSCVYVLQDEFVRPHLDAYIDKHYRGTVGDTSTSPATTAPPSSTAPESSSKSVPSTMTKASSSHVGNEDMSIMKLQTVARGFLARSSYHKMRNGFGRLQTVIRARAERAKESVHRKKVRAATDIQRFLRHHWDARELKRLRNDARQADKVYSIFALQMSLYHVSPVYKFIFSLLDEIGNRRPQG
jgi:hypothetical protein